MIPRLSLAEFFVFAVELMSELFVTVKRVDAFLKLPEHLPDRGQDPTDRGAIEVVAGNFGWQDTREEEQGHRATSFEQSNPDSSGKVSTLHRSGFHAFLANERLR